MRQREIWFADLNPTQGSEQAGLRPVVIVSGDTMNQHSNLCIICPLSSKIKNFPATLLLKKTTHNGLSNDSEVLIFQIRVLSQSRLTRKIGEIMTSELNQIIKELNGIFEI